jgi:hypothetical protein
MANSFHSLFLLICRQGHGTRPPGSFRRHRFVPTRAVFADRANLRPIHDTSTKELLRVADLNESREVVIVHMKCDPNQFHFKIGKRIVCSDLYFVVCSKHSLCDSLGESVRARPVTGATPPHYDRRSGAASMAAADRRPIRCDVPTSLTRANVNRFSGRQGPGKARVRSTN